MNRVETRHSLPHTPYKLSANETAICKFISILILKRETHLPDPSLFYKNLVCRVLCLSPLSSQKKVEKRQKIALLYAKILNQYEAGKSVEGLFKYSQLICLIEYVFKRHIRKNHDLFSRGLAISLDHLTFYAKVEPKGVFIITGTGVKLGSGNFGVVNTVLEIASKQLLALKCAKTNRVNGFPYLYKEVRRLNKLHDHALQENLNVKGLQALPLATFDMPENNLVAYLSLLGNQDLIKWTFKSHTTTERLLVCKALMHAFKNKNQLGIWHGDIKPGNILMTNDGPLLIDWTGAKTYKKSAETRQLPRSQTADFINTSDRHQIKTLLLDLIFFPAGTSNEIEEKNNMDFINAAKSEDLFAMAMTLFIALVPKRPFTRVIEIEKKLLPFTHEEIDTESLLQLKKMDYPDDIVEIMKKMLAHDSSLRYSTEEAIAIWESIKV